MDGVVGFHYCGKDYYYRKNLLGDVIGIYQNGTCVAQYTYDAWGKVLQVLDGNGNDVSQDEYHIAYLNPFRYRSYYYDIETGLYYLETRYYDPETGRFLNSDSVEYLDPETLGGLNLYAYCNNNPVMNVDPSGTFWLTTLIVGFCLGAVFGFGGTVVADYADDGEIFNGSVSCSEYLGNTVGGGIAGAGISVCSTLGATVGAASLGLGTVTTGLTISGGTAFAIGASTAFISGGLGYISRVAISDKEQFSFDDMLIESSANLLNGAMSFAGGVIGGKIGVKIPGVKSNVGDFFTYQLSQVIFGIYPSKFLISYTKNKLKEAW